MHPQEPTDESSTARESSPRESELLAFAVDLGTCRTEPEVYALAAESLAPLIRADRMAIGLLDAGSTSITLVPLGDPRGPSSLGRIDLEDTSADAALHNGQQFIADATKSITEDARRLHAEGFRSSVISPLSASSAPIGTLHADSRRADGFTREDRRLLAHAGRAIGSAVERVRSFKRAAAERERQRARTARLGELRRVEAELSLVLTRDEVFEVIARTIGRIIPANYVSYLELGASGEEARVWGILGPESLRREGMRVALRPGSAITEVMARGAHYIPDTRLADHPEHRALSGGGVGSALNLAVTRNEETIGALNVGVPRVDGIDEEDQALLDALASFIGLTFERIEAQEGAAESIRSSEALLRSLVDDCPVLLVVLDVKSRITRVSEFGARGLGYRVEDMVGRPYAEFHPAKEWRLVGEHLTALLAGTHGEADQVVQWEVSMTAANGETRWTRQYGRFLKGPDGKPMILLTCEDVSEVRELHDQLEEQAQRDSLTGAYNRLVLETRLDALAAQGDARGSLMLLDVDHFKLINDRLGHAAGDVVLKRLTSAIQRSADPADLIARVGGDEFVVLMPDRSLSAATKLAKALVAEVSGMTMDVDGGMVDASISVGIAHFDGPVNPKDLIAEADAAVYAAKAAGGCRVETASQTSETQRRRRSASEWLDRMRHALEHGGFMLYAQPIHPLTAQAGLAFEVLLRLQGDRGEAIAPGSFIPFAEAYNLVAEIDRWVISHTLGALTSVQVNARCFVNISGASLDDTRFSEDVAKMVQESAVPGHALAFEVTETATVRYADRARAFIEGLRALDCWVALDDFGSGFSSLGQLGDLPADVLKIDGVLVRDIASDRRSLAMLRAVVGMAKALGLRTIAEHVESEQTLTALLNIGADWAQGFHLGPPRPLHVMLRELSQLSPTAAISPGGASARAARSGIMGIPAKAGPSRF
ncbi:MAG: EAL domain-containing protein [Thermoleophilia bacterium]|nr:EAL domain-containing protein [Thermoleophilia bacterium]